MTLFAPLRYFAARLRYRDDAAAHHLRIGLGIEIRARKLAAHWRPHQDASRAAQARWQARGNRLAVLGAGRLLDFAHDAAKRFGRVRFVDADPLCARFWRRHANHEAAIADVSGMRPAPPKRGEREDSWENALRAIAETRFAPPPDAPWLAGCDAVLSLNLLSQLPVGWQERVEEQLRRRFGRATTQAREEEWLAAVDPGARSLVDAHLELLAASGAGSILLITDLAYLEYSGRSYARDRCEPPPVRWADGEWIGAAPGLRCHAWPALHGVEAPRLRGYSLSWRENWLWHISPQGAESPDKGHVHLVGAFAFER